MVGCSEPVQTVEETTVANSCLTAFAFFFNFVDYWPFNFGSWINQQRFLKWIFSNVWFLNTTLEQRHQRASKPHAISLDNFNVYSCTFYCFALLHFGYVYLHSSVFARETLLLFYCILVTYLVRWLHGWSPILVAFLFSVSLLFHLRLKQWTCWPGLKCCSLYLRFRSCRCLSVTPYTCAPNLKDTFWQCDGSGSNEVPDIGLMASWYITIAIPYEPLFLIRTAMKFNIHLRWGSQIKGSSL